ncbi:MAG: hypothetical protein ACXQS2_03020, partial [Methermicoccaceae archaeon]
YAYNILMLSQMPMPFKDALNIISLKTFGDLVNITSTAPQRDVSWIVGVIVVIKWAALIAALLLFYVTITQKLRIKNDLIPIALTVVTVLVICIFFTNPFADVDNLNARFSKIAGALTYNENVTYKPTLLRDIPFQNPLRILLEKVPTNVTGPAIENDQLVFKTYDIAPILLIILLLAAIVFLSKLSRLITIIVAALIITTIIGISDMRVLDAVIIVSSAILIYLLLRTKSLQFLIVYPVGLLILAVIDVLQFPPNIMFILFGMVFVCSLIPLFYVIGLILKGVGTIRETRTKFGIKKKPAKIIEESAGEYDPLVASLLLSLLFTVSIILYGTTIGALGFFITTVIGILRR